MWCDGAGVCWSLSVVSCTSDAMMEMPSVASSC